MARRPTLQQAAGDATMQHALAQALRRPSVLYGYSEYSHRYPLVRYGYSEYSHRYWDRTRSVSARKGSILFVNGGVWHGESPAHSR
jgi:hypothetical protein